MAPKRRVASRRDQRSNRRVIFGSNSPFLEKSVAPAAPIPRRRHARQAALPCSRPPSFVRPGAAEFPDDDSRPHPRPALRRTALRAPVRARGRSVARSIRILNTTWSDIQQSRDPNARRARRADAAIHPPQIPATPPDPPTTPHRETRPQFYGKRTRVRPTVIPSTASPRTPRTAPGSPVSNPSRAPAARVCARRSSSCCG
jgi:hypothetical protein